MKRRVSFNSEEIRNLFFQECLKSLSLKKWKNLRDLFNVPKSVLEFYRNGKLTLPEELYEKLSKKLQEKDRSFFNKDIRYMGANWGQTKGGMATYLKHKEIFDNGRKKAIGVIRLRTHKFDINLSLSLELAYFIGLFIGDGFTNKHGGYHIIQFTGDFSLDMLGNILRKDFK